MEMYYYVHGFCLFTRIFIQTDGLPDGLQMVYQICVYQTVITINWSICLDTAKTVPVSCFAAVGFIHSKWKRK